MAVRIQPPLWFVMEERSDEGAMMVKQLGYNQAFSPAPCRHEGPNSLDCAL